MLQKSLLSLLLFGLFCSAYAQTETVAEPETAVSAASGSVARATFTSTIEAREPSDSLSETGAEIVYFFTELVDLQGQTITHRWLHGGETLAEITHNVGGPRWRVWSSKKLMPQWAGEWRVDVVNSTGEVLTSRTLNYQPDAGSPAVESTPTTEPEPETLPEEVVDPTVGE